MRAFREWSPAARAVVAVSATSLFMVLVAWATLIGPDAVFTGPGVIERSFTPTERTCLPVPSPSDGATAEVPDNPDNLPLCDEPVSSTGQARPAVQEPPPLWLKILVWVFVFAAAALFLVMVLVLVRLVRDQVGPRRKRELHQSATFATLDEPARLTDEILAGARDQDAVLREGDPRNAIVAAWQRFEVQGEAAGVGRQQWETSSEYAMRILDLVSADSGATNRLAALYREARFSEHPITEDHRSRALEALGVIRHSLGVRA